MKSAGPIFILCCFFSTLVLANKYSATLNGSGLKKDNARPFRMNKVNLVWEKAQKKLPRKRLDDLYSDLSLQDKLEMQAKKAADQDGDKQAAARKHMLEILANYGLDDHFEDISSNHILSEKYEKDENRFKNDEKLHRLWKKAKASGFTDAELAILMKEFTHYKEKQKEYHLLKNEVDELSDISENAIHGHLADEDSWKQMKMKRKQLKDRHQNMKNHYENLAAKAERTFALQSEFEEPKVIELWTLAKKANFTEEELNSLKEELTHFEHKVKKQSYLKEQVELLAATFHRPGKMNELPDKHVQLEERLRDYSYKVKKYHHEIKSKIVKAFERHTEL